MTIRRAEFPKTYRVDVLPPPKAALAEIIRFFLAVDPDYGTALVGELLDAANTLDRLPYRFQAFRPSRTARRTVRAMPCGDYRIFYRVRERDRVVEIIMFRHGARRSPTRFPAK